MNDIMYDVIFPKCGNASYCKYSKNQENCCADDRIIENCPYLRAIQQITLLSMELTETYEN